VEPAKGYHSTDANTLDMLERGEPQTVVWRKLDHGPGFRFPQGRYADWTIGRIRRDAALIGPATAARCGGTVATVVEPPRNAPEQRGVEAYAMTYLSDEDFERLARKLRVSLSIGRAAAHPR
jgi:hypothetical protein